MKLIFDSDSVRYENIRLESDPDQLEISDSVQLASDLDRKIAISSSFRFDVSVLSNSIRFGSKNCTDL